MKSARVPELKTVGIAMQKLADQGNPYTARCGKVLSPNEQTGDQVARRKARSTRTKDEQALIDASLNLACALNWRRMTKGRPSNPAVVQAENTMLKQVALGIMRAIRVQKIW